MYSRHARDGMPVPLAGGAWVGGAALLRFLQGCGVNVLRVPLKSLSC
jgi:hypothetical protein